jgi:hypothetical protein
MVILKNEAKFMQIATLYQKTLYKLESHSLFLEFNSAVPRLGSQNNNNSVMFSCLLKNLLDCMHVNQVEAYIKCTDYMNTLQI